MHVRWVYGLISAGVCLLVVFGNGHRSRGEGLNRRRGTSRDAFARDMSKGVKGGGAMHDMISRRAFLTPIVSNQMAIRPSAAAVLPTSGQNKVRMERNEGMDAAAVIGVTADFYLPLAHPLFGLSKLVDRLRECATVIRGLFRRLSPSESLTGAASCEPTVAADCGKSTGSLRKRPTVRTVESLTSPKYKSSPKRCVAGRPFGVCLSPSALEPAPSSFNYWKCSSRLLYNDQYSNAVEERDVHRSPADAHTAV